MKNKSILIFFSALLMLLLFSCEENEKKGYPKSSIMPVFLKVHDIQANGFTLDFTVDFALMANRFGSCFTGFPKDSVYFYSWTNHNTGEHFQYSIQNFQTADTMPVTPFSILLLIDMSGTYAEIDQKNERFQAFNALLQLFNHENEIAIAAYSRGGTLDKDTFQIISPFTRGWTQETALKVLELTEKEGGTSCLYEGMFRGLNYLNSNAKYNQKHLVVLAHAKDDNKGIANESDVVNFARQHHIPVHIGWWSFTSTYNLFTRIPAKTGGMSAACFFDEDVNTFIPSLNRLLGISYSFYRIKVRLTRDTYYWPNNSYFWDACKLSLGSTMDGRLQFYIDIP